MRFRVKCPDRELVDVGEGRTNAASAETVLLFKKTPPRNKAPHSGALSEERALWTHKWGSVCHTWLLGMSGRLQSQNKQTALGPSANRSMLIFFTLKTYIPKKENINFWRRQKVKGVEVLTIKVAKSVLRALSRSLDYRAVTSAIGRLVKLPGGWSQ